MVSVGLNDAMDASILVYAASSGLVPNLRLSCVHSSELTRSFARFALSAAAELRVFMYSFSALSATRRIPEMSELSYSTLFTHATWLSMSARGRLPTTTSLVKDGFGSCWPATSLRPRNS